MIYRYVAGTHYWCSRCDEFISNECPVKKGRPGMFSCPLCRNWGKYFPEGPIGAAARIAIAEFLTTTLASTDLCKECPKYPQCLTFSFKEENSV